MFIGFYQNVFPEVFQKKTKNGGNHKKLLGNAIAGVAKLQLCELCMSFFKLSEKIYVFFLVFISITMCKNVKWCWVASRPVVRGCRVANHP